MKTYLELINLVLADLREDAVTSVTADDYTEMIGRFVNRAKQQCEDAHEWSALLTEWDLTTTASVRDYALTGAGNSPKVDFVYNENRDCVMRERRRSWVQEQVLGDNYSDTQPTCWTQHGVDANGDAVIRLFPRPDDVYVITAVGWQRQADLDSNDDTLSIPHAPVVDLALAFAVRERGETGGQVAMEYFELAKRSLSDAIALDAARNDYEDDWYVV